MSITKAQARANFTMKIGDQNYGLTIPMSGWSESAQDNLLIGFMGMLSNVSEALPTTATLTKYLNASPIPPNSRGKRPRSFKFQIVENVPAGDEARNQIVTLKVPEYDATPSQEATFIQYCIDFIRVFGDDDVVQLLGVY